MANVSTRVDEQTKLDAEKIADEIGISLSAAINVFLKRFISNKGFPFDVVVPNDNIVNIDKLDELVKKAVADPNNTGLAKQFTYLDPNTNKLINVSRKEQL